MSHPTNYELKEPSQTTTWVATLFGTGKEVLNRGSCSLPLEVRSRQEGPRQPCMNQWGRHLIRRRFCRYRGGPRPWKLHHRKAPRHTTWVSLLPFLTHKDLTHLKTFLVNGNLLGPAWVTSIFWHLHWGCHHVQVMMHIAHSIQCTGPLLAHWMSQTFTLMSHATTITGSHYLTLDLYSPT